VSAARNMGIKEAKYNWICFLDGDDLWDKEHLKEYAEAIYGNDAVSWLISGFISRKNNRTWNFVYDRKGILNIFQDLHEGLKIHTSTVCIKKAFFDEYTDLYFREGLNSSEDREVWYKLCCIDPKP